MSPVWSLDLACLRLKGSKHIVLAHDHQGLSMLNICETNQGKKIPAWIIVWNLMTVLVWLSRQRILWRLLGSQCLDCIDGVC